MPYLEQEKTRLQSEVQVQAALIAGLTPQLNTQQQAVAAAQARVNAAQAKVADAQASIPTLAASAAAADATVRDLNNQIADHEANEPDQILEIPRPRPNPAWRTWKKELDRLTGLRAQAQTDAAAADTRLSNAQAVVAQAQAELQAAQSQAAVAAAAVQATQTAMAAAQDRQNSAQQLLGELDSWNTEIARDPLNRSALEPAAAELTARTAALEDTYATARLQNEDAEQALAALVARRDQLVPMLNDVNAQLPAAQTERQAAQAALTAAARRIETHVKIGPR